MDYKLTDSITNQSQVIVGNGGKSRTLRDGLHTMFWGSLCVFGFSLIVAFWLLFFTLAKI